MKKNKISFGINPLLGHKIGNPFYALAAFFDFAHLDYHKNILSEAVLYSQKRKIYKQDNPCEVFVFYSTICSFLRVCYCLKIKSKKWKVKESARSEDVFHLSSLTKQEFDNPFLVFQKAFSENTLEEFEFFIWEVTQLSLSPHQEEFDYDLMTPYVYLIKMLDAAELMRERGVEKIKKDALSEE